MKNRFIYVMIISLLFSYNSIENYKYYEEIESIEYLLNERIVIMNEFLYGCKDMNSLENKLDKIEAENLLKNDLGILYKVIDNPTDYELALNVHVDKINSLLKTKNGLQINADLKWLMSGYDGEFSMVKNYNIKCVELDKQMYLASLIYNE
ncbi:MAG: hypothetical protein SA378_01640 [Sedimentibacter sp.]|uniref:hypothetical protein n=1 Tax=Sedimentibacter sp. TaxID=1960295 RepID=UPI002981104F|nr:hypothetical protein [Sedimentibacter sp.]MDW5298833.1 hypothetical protein [Sedimentibacter sp.]